MQSVQSHAQHIPNFLEPTSSKNEPKGQKVKTVAQAVLNPYGMSFIANDSPKAERVFREMKMANIFSTHNEKERAYQMVRLAGLMYQDVNQLESVRALFGNKLVGLPSPEKLGIKLPSGLKVQAFRNGNEVIIAIRGTELNADKNTLFFNLIADMGIGRHKSDSELINSLRRVSQEVFVRYGFNIEEHTLKMAENILGTRVKGHNDTERSYNILGRLASAFGSGAKRGGFWGTLGGIATAGGLAAVGVASWPISLLLIGAAGVSAAATGGGVNSMIEYAKCLTAADGYPTTISYIKTIDDYVMALKKERIAKEDSIITTRHSLGGYLAGVIGAMHGDEVFAFNGPGVTFDSEMKELIKNLGLKREVQELVEYHSYSMAGDFIGNLCERSGPIHHLHLPRTAEEAMGNLPVSYYGSPLAHHGIALMAEVIRHATVQEIHRNLLQQETPPQMLQIVPYGTQLMDIA